MKTRGTLQLAIGLAMFFGGLVFVVKTPEGWALEELENIEPTTDVVAICDEGVRIY